MSEAKHSPIEIALEEALIALPNHSPGCTGASVSGAACCYFRETHRNGVAALEAAEAERIAAPALADALAEPRERLCEEDA